MNLSSSQKTEHRPELKSQLIDAIRRADLANIMVLPNDWGFCIGLGSNGIESGFSINIHTYPGVRSTLDEPPFTRAILKTGTEGEGHCISSCVIEGTELYDQLAKRTGATVYPQQAA